MKSKPSMVPHARIVVNEYKELNKMHITELALLILISTAAHADISECNMKKDPDDKNWCMASYSGSAGFCEQIKNGERRRDCTFKVVKLQRENTYGTPKPKIYKDEQK